MKRAYKLLLCFAAAIIITCFVLYKPHQTPTPVQVSSKKSTSYYFTSNTLSSQGSDSTAAAQAGQSDFYIVKEYHGHIGVYRNNEAKPFKEYETDVLVLPESDRMELEQGKTAYTMAEVEKIVEDYDG